MDVIYGAEALIVRTLQQTKEQIRRLRSTMYFMDRDYEDKENTLKIDERNLSLTDKSLNLSMYHGFAPLDAG